MVHHCNSSTLSQMQGTLSTACLLGSIPHSNTFHYITLLITSCSVLKNYAVPDLASGTQHKFFTFLHEYTFTFTYSFTVPLFSHFPPNITTAIHLLHISHLKYFLGQYGCKKNP